MSATIIARQVPVDAMQRGKLQKLVASTEFILLREVIASHCALEQVKAMEASLYPKSEDALKAVELHQDRAIKANNCLEMLDALQLDEQKWFTVKLEHSH
jgi:hypothetical protein